MRILVTAGGTKEYIDGVRYIGNSSSGRTGALLTDYLTELGHEIIWLGADDAIRPNGLNKTQQVSYETYDELASQLQKLLTEQHFDLVFQAAAVSDFKVASVVINDQHFSAGRAVKLPSSDALQLNLTQNPKLVSQLKQWSSNEQIKVVAFKLTHSLDAEVHRLAVEKLITQSAIDMVAHNDLNDISDNRHGFDLFSQTNRSTTCKDCKDIRALADAVLTTLEKTS